MNQAPLDRNGAGRGTLKTCLTGFALACVLTAIPFALVMSGACPPAAILAGIGLAGLVQVWVHLHYFLHLDASAGMRWNVAALLFTILIMVLFVGGSIWIMASLNDRMM